MGCAEGKVAVSNPQIQNYPGPDTYQTVRNLPPPPPPSHTDHTVSEISVPPASQKSQKMQNGSFEEQIAFSRAILESETEYDMKTRLAGFGNFSSSYTLREMIDFNAQHGYTVIFPYHKKIVCAEAVKELVKPEIRQIEYDYLQNNPDIEYFRPHDFIWLAPISQMNNIGMKMPLIKRYVEKCIVAELAGTEKEYWQDVKQDVMTVISEIEKETSAGIDGEIYKNFYLQELKEAYERFLTKYNQTNGFPARHCQPAGDPNAVVFPLDSPFIENPGLLRAWVEEWEKFDTEVPEQTWDPWYFKVDYEDIPKPETILIRSELDDLPPFNHDIEGEAAWDVIEINLFKNDVTTAHQDEIWKQRESRSDLYDPKSMEKRRKKIENYFITKYEWPESKLDPYRGFCDGLQKSWQEFQDLCDT